MQRIQKSDRPTGLMALAVITCPCHLPLLIALLAGTAGGAWLAEKQTLIVAAMSLLFIIAVVGVWRRLTVSGPT